MITVEKFNSLGAWQRAELEGAFMEHVGVDSLGFPGLPMQPIILTGLLKFAATYKFKYTEQEYIKQMDEQMAKIYDLETKLRDFDESKEQDMKVNELRVGNLVYVGTPNVSGEVLAVDETTARVKYIRSDNGQPHVSRTDYEFIVGIPLTEDWLLKFGFISSKLCIRSYIHPETIKFELKNISALEGGFRIVAGNSEKLYFKAISQDIKYVHQLQNLYFELTGEELIIKA